MTSSGRGSHEMATEIRVYNDGYFDCSEQDQDEIAETLRDYMHWIYRQLEKEYDYLNSDEAVDESIKANEYEFTEDGTRA